ncbi:MAG: ABC transporter ATP-binding protein [Planctomycetota bacterium]
MGSAENNLIIKTEKLCKTYGVGTVAVRAVIDIDMQVRRGEFVAIMGPSGSGKSTLLHVLGCLHKATAGRYELAGIDVSKPNDTQLSQMRNKQIGMVFQKFNLLPHEDIVRNVELPLVYAGVGRRERRRRAEGVLTALGLGERLHHKPPELSGGQDQRVAIARALVNDPALILADEPTGNLDSTTGRDLMALLKSLNQIGRTIVMVTHNRNIASYADRIVHLKDGRILNEEAVSEHPEVKENSLDLSFFGANCGEPAER